MHLMFLTNSNLRTQSSCINLLLPCSQLNWCHQHPLGCPMRHPALLPVLYPLSYSSPSYTSQPPALPQNLQCPHPGLGKLSLLHVQCLSYTYMSLTCTMVLFHSSTYPIHPPLNRQNSGLKTGKKPCNSEQKMPQVFPLDLRRMQDLQESLRMTLTSVHLMHQQSFSWIIPHGQSTAISLRILTQLCAQLKFSSLADT